MRKLKVFQKLQKSRYKRIGIYRLTDKPDSIDTRCTITRELAESLARAGKEVVVYEPSLTHAFASGIVIENDLKKFKKKVKLIVTNRITKELDDVSDKLFTYDINK